jgi:Berberine and berberine like
MPRASSATRRDSGSRGRGRSPTRTRRGGAFPNFADPDLIDPARWYHGANRTRLDRIKETYDPKNLFRRHPAAA